MSKQPHSAEYFGGGHCTQPRAGFRGVEDQGTGGAGRLKDAVAVGGGGNPRAQLNFLQLNSASAGAIPTGWHRSARGWPRQRPTLGKRSEYFQPQQRVFRNSKREIAKTGPIFKFAEKASLRFKQSQLHLLGPDLLKQIRVSGFCNHGTRPQQSDRIGQQANDPSQAQTIEEELAQAELILFI